MDWHALTLRDVQVLATTAAGLLITAAWSLPRLWRFAAPILERALRMRDAAADQQRAAAERAALRQAHDAHEARLDALERGAGRLEERVDGLRREINGRIDLVLGELRSERQDAARRWRAAEARLLRAVRGALRATPAAAPGSGTPPGE